MCTHSDHNVELQRFSRQESNFPLFFQTLWYSTVNYPKCSPFMRPSVELGFLRLAPGRSPIEVFPDVVTINPRGHVLGDLFLWDSLEQGVHGGRLIVNFDS